MLKEKSNTLDDSLAAILKQLQQDDNLSVKSLLETMLNLVMKAERNVHLQSNPEDKGNGYFNRQLGTPLGSLSLEVPRDRDGDFRPAILPKPHQRDIEQRINFLESLLVCGYSPNSIAASFAEIGMHYNADELSTLKDEYLRAFQQWQTRELDKDMIALYIDVYHASANLDGKVVKVAIYVILGIDFNGVKSLLGIYLYKGHETKGFWLQTLNQIIDRGLCNPLYIISDDFSGLKDAVSTLFPKAYHQLCTVHMQRNVHRNMDKQDAIHFNESFSDIKNAKDFETCTREFKQLCEQYQKDYPSFIKALLEDTNNYFACTKLPKSIRKFFYSSNAVESANSCIERLRIRMGGFFQSEAALQVNIYLIFRRLSEKKWQHGVPWIKNELYAVRQLFAQTYDRQPMTP